MNPTHRPLRRAGRQLAVAFSATVAVSALAQPAFHLTVYPAVPGKPSTYPYAMNNNGVIIGLAGDDRFDPAGFPLATNGAGYDFLPMPPDTSFSFPQGITDNGLVVGVNQLAAFRFSGPADYLPPAPGYGNGFAYGANDSGRICGSQVNDLFGIEAPAWWPAGDQPARFLPGPSELPQGGAKKVNAAGQIAGVMEGRAVRWDDPNAQPTVDVILDGSFGSEFTGLNDLGDACGRAFLADSVNTAVIYQDATAQMLDIGGLGGGYSLAWELNDDRWVVGESNTVSGPTKAFLWVDGQMYDLSSLVVSTNEDFLFLSTAVDVNNAGQIAVQVQLDTPDGQARIGLLTPVPTCPGDADGDLDVDLDDLLLVLGEFGCQADCVAGDVDGDSDVDLDDLLIVLGAFDSSCIS